VRRRPTQQGAGLPEVVTLGHEQPLETERRVGGVVEDLPDLLTRRSYEGV